MDILSIAGILIALLAILGGQALEGGHVGSILQLTAFIIVIGGTLGACMLQFPLPVFMRSLKMLSWIFKPPHHSSDELIGQVIDWSNAARKGGLLALEPMLDNIQDPFTRKGLQMLVDGAEPDKLRNVMEVELEAREHHDLQAAKVYESAGGYAPTVGILGAVLGLIHVMENLADPSKLGGGIAVAFVATVYGVGSANLLFLPIANKLKGIVHHQSTLKEMLIQGLGAIAEGENPRLIESKLQSYVT